jgi:predicted RNase H-like HicB family nuclease
MKIRIVVHEAEDGGFWAEVPAIPAAPRKVIAWMN